MWSIVFDLCVRKKKERKKEEEKEQNRQPGKLGVPVLAVSPVLRHHYYNFLKQKISHNRNKLINFLMKTPYCLSLSSLQEANSLSIISIKCLDAIAARRVLVSIIQLCVQRVYRPNLGVISLIRADM